ncbi:hypothetical protein OIV68_33490, partial [Burkholderia pseudomallei]
IRRRRQWCIKDSNSVIREAEEKDVNGKSQILGPSDAGKTRERMKGRVGKKERRERRETGEVME